MQTYANMLYGTKKVLAASTEVFCAGDHGGWVCSRSPMSGTVTYNCVPEVQLTSSTSAVQCSLTDCRLRPPSGSRLRSLVLPRGPT